MKTVQQLLYRPIVCLYWGFSVVPACLGVLLPHTKCPTMAIDLCRWCLDNSSTTQCWTYLARHTRLGNKGRVCILCSCTGLRDTQHEPHEIDSLASKVAPLVAVRAV